jgi:hypothetical protein
MTTVSKLCTPWPVEQDPLYGCHRWRGRVNNHGYPVVYLGRKPVSAYSVAWRREHGDIPEGMELDHLCRRILCVNPAHLEVVTRRENELRKSWGRRARRTHCSQGHDLWTQGRRTPEGGKVCLVCSGLLTGRDSATPGAREPEIMGTTRSSPKGPTIS